MKHPYHQPNVRTWTRAEKSRRWSLDHILRQESLPETLDFRGEFGTELALFLPFMNWLSTAGWLSNRKIGTYYGMRCFYDDLDCKEIVEKRESRTSQPPPSFLPVQKELAFRFCGHSAFHLFPDLRRKFSRLSCLPLSIGDLQRPLLVVHNKHNYDLRMGPVNHISLVTLDRIFSIMTKYYHVVYIRHGIGPLQDDFSEDHNHPMPFDDRAILQRYKTVMCFDDEYDAYRAQGGEVGLNAFKNLLFSRCFHYISSQGGGATHIASFSGSLLMVLHRVGTELQWGYHNGYYGMASNPAPIVAVCRNERDLIRGLGLFLDPLIYAGRAVLSPSSARLIAALCPNA